MCPSLYANVNASSMHLPVAVVLTTVETVLFVQISTVDEVVLDRLRQIGLDEQVDAYRRAAALAHVRPFALGGPPQLLQHARASHRSLFQRFLAPVLKSFIAQATILRGAENCDFSDFGPNSPK